MDANGYDKLQFGEGITKEDVSLYQDKLHDESGTHVIKKI
jgi:hypothetical protein